MSVATIAFYICILYFFVGGVIHIVGTLYFAKQVRDCSQEYQNDVNSYAAKLYIVIPVYQEQKCVTESLNYFSQFISQGVYKGIYVTSAREREVSSVTTHEVIETYLHEHLDCSFQVIEAPAEYMGKSGQLNYALTYLNQTNCIGKYDYIGIYDVDSRPSLGTINLLHHLINSFVQSKTNCPIVFQQVSLYCHNVNKFGLKNILNIDDAVLQSQWSIGFDYLLSKIYYKATLNHKLTPIVYCVGHGCFISLPYLSKIGGIPTINKNDDLSLGYLLSASQETIFPLPYVDLCEIAPSVRESIKQYKNWAKGSFLFWHDIRTYIKMYNLSVSYIQKTCLWVEGISRNFFWAYRGFMLLFITIYAIINPLQWVDASIAISLYCFIPYILTCFYINSYTKNEAEITWLKIIIGTLCSPISVFLRSLGPFSAQFAQRDANFKVNRI